MSQRFFTTSVDGSQAVLVGAEAHHLTHVMRAKVGDQVLLFDGSGAEYMARVAQIGRSEVCLSVSGREEVDRELGRQIVLAVALPKGDRQRWLVEKAVELGVTRLVPIRTQYAVAQPQAAALERLRRTVIEATKQCGRTRLMDVAAARDFSEFVVSAREPAVRLIAHCGGGPLGDALREEKPSRELDTECLLAIGPEGGFTPQEVDLATQNGWQAVDLGPRILRVETAAVALAAVVGLS